MTTPKKIFGGSKIPLSTRRKGHGYEPRRIRIYNQRRARVEAKSLSPASLQK
jgi:hypothetical protein